MFEKSMLYIPHDVENRILRGKGFRVLGLCHLGLSRLDQALEYINEAEKVFLFILSWTFGSSRLILFVSFLQILLSKKKFNF